MSVALASRLRERGKKMTEVSSGAKTGLRSCECKFAPEASESAARGAEG